jgi:hypothetical protein
MIAYPGHNKADLIFLIYTDNYLYAEQQEIINWLTEVPADHIFFSGNIVPGKDTFHPLILRVADRNSHVPGLYMV